MGEMEYMLVMENYARERRYGGYEKAVRLIRKHRLKWNIEEMADAVDVTKSDCLSVLSMMDHHPDWNDEQIAEEVTWES